VRSAGVSMSATISERRLFGPGDVARHDQHEIFDADAVFAGLVIAGFVGEDHARAQRLGRAAAGVERLGDTLRPLMHRQIGAHAVAGAVRVIQPRFPQRAAREPVELAAGGAGREDRRRQRDMAARG
jgi:hypothetical protein